MKVNGGIAADGKLTRKCCECGGQGHKKQSSCDEIGNCRVEFNWDHSCSMKRDPIRDNQVQPMGKRARSSSCEKLMPLIHDASRRVGATRNALRTLGAAVISLEAYQNRMPIPADGNKSILHSTLDESLAPQNPVAHSTNVRGASTRVANSNGSAKHCQKRTQLNMETSVR